MADPTTRRVSIFNKSTAKTGVPGDSGHSDRNRPDGERSETRGAPDDLICPMAREILLSEMQDQTCRQDMALKFEA
jgi:hypothetical protein